MTKVSVLVAVYNAGQYLHQCLDSLLSQTLKDIQVICVDDASTDNSLDILNDYADKDERIEVVHLEENQGQAHARNVALCHVRGEFTCMVDADDWLSEDALEQAVKAFEEETGSVLFDVIISRDGKEELYQLPEFESISGKEAFRMSLTWEIHGLYMIRTSLHLSHPYDESCRLYSDDNTTRIHYLASRKVRHCTGRYYYRQHQESSTHRITVRRFDFLKANENMRKQMISMGVGEDLLNLYENSRWLNLIDVYMFYHVHGKELKEKERTYGQLELLRIWQSIDRKALSKEVTAKFGYHPCCCWTFFRIQEWLYFTLRGLQGKNR